MAHQTNLILNLNKDKTDKLIWKYLSSSNLLDSFRQIEITKIDRIAVLEKATHNKNYPEEDLFKIYKQFQFNINQLLNAETSYKSLSKIEARTLIYEEFFLSLK